MNLSLKCPKHPVTGENRLIFMKTLTRLIACFILIPILPYVSGGQEKTDRKNSPDHTVFFSLAGEKLTSENLVNTGIKLNSPLLQLSLTNSKPSKGVIYLLTEGTPNLLNTGAKSEMLIRFLVVEGFDVANLKYIGGSELTNACLTMSDVLKAYRLLRKEGKKMGLCGGHYGIMGISSGCRIAAKAQRILDDNEQPDELILIDPSKFDSTVPGTVFPAYQPPFSPKSRLLCIFSENKNKELIKSAREYTKTWIGYDGEANFSLVTDSIKSSTAAKDLNLWSTELADGLRAFFADKAKKTTSAFNPAASPVAGYSLDRHAEKLALVAREKFDLVMIGNSITNNFEKPEYQSVWQQFFEPRKALNLGYSGYRTENLLWNIQNGELEGQSPKVIIVEIGTNNVDEKNYPTRHTAGQLAGGIEAIVKLLRKKCPDSKIVVMRCFPGCYGRPNPTSHRAILERASDLVSKLADQKHVFYCDVNHVFLNMDGSISHDMMPDWLHPSPEGAKRWAQAMEPLLSELMGDRSLDTEIPTNSAIVPASKLEEDSYDWFGRHAEILQIKDSLNPEIVLIGNSITHFWGGEPHVRNADGSLRIPNGPKTWASLFGNHRVLNLGFGWDRTQNVLWRLDNGELDGLHPNIVVIDIGTNNTSQTSNARMNSAEEIVEGIRTVCQRVRSKVPGTKIILMAVFPREQKADNPRRILINEINRRLEMFASKERITLVDIGPKMLSPDGTISKEIMGDFCHPTEKGYQIWADGIRSLLEEPYRSF